MAIKWFPESSFQWRIIVKHGLGAAISQRLSVTQHFNTWSASKCKLTSAKIWWNKNYGHL